MVEKFRPDFLNPEINVSPLVDGRYVRGFFTEVGNLDSLPEEVQKNTPEGYVIKQYLGIGNPEEVAKELLLKEGSKGEKVSIVGIAKELQQRHEMIKKYFDQSLPDLVLPTQLIVGKNEMTKKNSLYEIQSRLDPSSTTNIVNESTFWPVFECFVHGEEKSRVEAEKELAAFIDYLHNTFPQQIGQFKNQLKIFIEQIKNFQTQTNHLPFDCAMLTNLIFTKDGLRLIDTNAIVPTPLPLRGKEIKPVEKFRQMNWRKQMFNGSLEILNIIESKL